MFKEAEIRTFIEGTTHLLRDLGAAVCDVGSPYLVTDGKPGAYEYTGVIGISGARKGVGLLHRAARHAHGVLMRMQETDTSDESIPRPRRRGRQYHLRQCAPRLRQEFRHSVPVVIAHDEEKVTTPHTRSFRDSHQLAHALRQSWWSASNRPRKADPASGHRHHEPGGKGQQGSGPCAKARRPWQLVD